MVKKCCTYYFFLYVITFYTTFYPILIEAVYIQTLPFYSIFGDEVDLGRDEYIALNFQYGYSTNDVTPLTGTGASILTTNNMVTLQTGAAVGKDVYMWSKRNIRFRAGHESYAMFTAAFPTGGLANSVQWIGPFLSVNATVGDGCAIGYSNTAFSIAHGLGSKGSTPVTTIVPQSSFNLDTLDGNGPSGFVLAPALMNIYRISYAWSGSAIILFQVMNSNGTWIPFHQFQLTNIASTPVFSNPCFPITAQAKGTASGILQLQTSCWNAGSIGNVRDGEELRYFTASNTNITVGNAAIVPILSIQAGTTMNGTTVNQIEARLRAWSGRVNGAVDPNAAAIYLIKNATLTGSSFAAVDSVNSMMKVDTSATALSGGTTLLFQAPSADNTGSNSHTKYFSDADIEILMHPGDSADSIAGDILTIGVISLLTSSVVSGSLTWEERN